MKIYTCLDDRHIPMWIVGDVEVTWWGGSWWHVSEYRHYTWRAVNGFDNALRTAVELAGMP